MLAWMPRHVFSRGKQTHRASTVPQQPDDNASEDRGSREGTLGLVTDLFFWVKRQGFFGVSLHGDEFDRHPWDSTESGCTKLTLADLPSLLCMTEISDSKLLTHWTAESHNLPIWGIKKSISSSGRPSEPLITGKNVSCQMLSRQLQNTSQSYFCQSN